MGMRVKGSLLLGAAALVVVGARSGWAEDTVTGEVVNLTCQLAGKGGACEPGGLQKGLPMALKTADGQLYLLLEDHDNPKAYAQVKEKESQKVTIEGDKVTQGGTQGLIVETVK